MVVSVYGTDSRQYLLLHLIFVNIGAILNKRKTFRNGQIPIDNFEGSHRFDQILVSLRSWVISSGKKIEDEIASEDRGQQIAASLKRKRGRPVM